MMGKYGIKAYGNWHEFKTKREYTNYLMSWIINTEGSEQERAVSALVNLNNGYNRTDTDTDTKEK